MMQPSTAAILQGKVGARNAGAFDISAVCAGFVYAVSVAFSMMRGCDRYRKVLVVGAETYSRILDWKDRTTCVFFGDGAGAVVLGETREPGYLSQFLAADGTKWDVIQFPAGGSRLPTSQHTLDGGMHSFRMQGKQVWDFATKAFPEAVTRAAELAGVAVSDIDWVISHQANINIIQAGMAALGLPMNRTHTTIERTANTSGASVPIALDDAVTTGRIKPGQLVCMVGFGGGLAWGAVLVRWVQRGCAC
jgi:3-oxoacyl-[acyl-carrier-protein] synthase-3